MSTTALLIIDLFNDFDFEGGDDLLRHTESIIDPILNLKHQFSIHDLPVIYCNDHFGQWKDNTDDIIQHAAQSKGYAIAKQMAPAEFEYFIIKPKHSAFYGTQLDLLLRQLNVDRIVMTGVAADICILFSANDGYMRDYELIVPRDCIASENAVRHESALTILRRSLGVSIEASTTLHFPY